MEPSRNEIRRCFPDDVCPSYREIPSSHLIKNSPFVKQITSSNVNVAQVFLCSFNSDLILFRPSAPESSRSIMSSSFLRTHWHSVDPSMVPYLLTNRTLHSPFLLAN